MQTMAIVMAQLQVLSPQEQLMLVDESKNIPNSITVQRSRHLTDYGSHMNSTLSSITDRHLINKNIIRHKINFDPKFDGDSEKIFELFTLEKANKVTVNPHQTAQQQETKTNHKHKKAYK